ncbi:WG repeat-containing protein [Achromobacter sp. ACM04]|uniref:WG repeat-containing protein n=1 Tax=Achromobacter sp. ACM04 TaxID=2769312 RepID=UPI001786FF9E|nr:WG repeat-containing protein [Achromobacter sp. ACM04]MBD9420770.1 WG repeat-containing protein [Achromobacter sp. ACM04]
MKTPLALKPLALAVALAALPAVPGAAQARSNWIDQCAPGYNEYNGANLECQQAFHEGLAAVLTGSADDDAGRWGYLDKRGRMAIAPSFQEAKSFQNGLAAVNQDGLWGYIDTQGQWAIKPRFSEATGFNAEGSALAEEDGHDVLIDRKGNIIKTFELGTRSWGFQRGQKLASMEMPMPPRLFNTATGKAATLPAGVMALAAPSGGYLPAQLRDSRYSGWWGLLDEQARWAIAPDVLRAREPALRDGDVLAVSRDAGWTFVDPRGKTIHKQRYEHVQLAGPGLWLVKQKGAGKALLLNAKLGVQHAFKGNYIGLDEREGWRVMIDDEAVLLIDPAGNFRKIDARHGRVQLSNGQAWVTASLPPRAVDMAVDAAEAAAVAADAAAAGAAAVPDDGPGKAVEASADAAVAAQEAVAAAAAASEAETVAVDVATPAAMDVAAAAVDAAAQATSADAAPDTGGGLLQIYTREGKPLLDADTVARLQDYDIRAFSARESAHGRAFADSLPLALLRPLDYTQPLGILTSKGKIVTNPDWEDMSSYDVTMPLPVRAANGKYGAIDADGNWAVQPRYSVIHPFRGGYAQAGAGRSRSDGDQLIDARGKAVAVPAEILDGARYFDGELIQYRAPDENRENRWGIWNVAKGAPAVKPVYESMEKFEDDWTKVQHQDRWGVMNREGKWVVPATQDSSYKLEYLGNGLMLVEDNAPGQRSRSSFDTTYRLVNLRTGKPSEPVTGKPERLKDGRYLAALAGGGTMLFDAKGGATRVSDGRAKRTELYQHWLYIEHDDREGAIDARGNMKVPAIYGEFNPFFAQPEGLARAYNGSDYRVIDQDGKTVLGKLGDGSPLATMQRIVFHDSENSVSIMTDLQGREITRIDGTYSVEDRSANEGVAPYRSRSGNGRHGFIDANGKRIVGPHFDTLGPLNNGLAVARRLQYSGTLYGYIDLTGRYAIPPVFTWAGNFSEERALVRSNHQGRNTQYIDTKGVPIATFTEVCDTVTILDDQGRITWPQQKMDCPVADKFELAPDNAKAKQP